MILLNPGPVNVSERVRKALHCADLCHREEEFSDLLGRVRGKITEAFAPQGGYTAVVLTGSGTAAVEAALCSFLDQGEKVLVLSNGVYGERMAQIAAAYGLESVQLKFSWRQPPDLEQVEEVLSRDSKIRAVAMVHHETTTGLLNPVEEIGKLCRRYEKRFLLDSVSGLGGEKLDLQQAGVDLCAGTAGKCIQGFAGVSFVLLRHEEAERLEKIPPRSLYLHLPTYFSEQEKGSVPFTPAVQLYWAFDEALDELLEEGVEQRVSRYQESARLLRSGFLNFGLDLYLSEALLSNSITSLCLPGGVGYEALHDGLKRRGYVIYAGQGTLRSSLFRVANMGALRPSDFEDFLSHLGEVLSSFR